MTSDKINKMNVEERSELLALKVLTEGKRLIKAPAMTRRAGIHYEFILAIGDDEVAYLTMTDDAYDELTK